MEISDESPLAGFTVNDPNSGQYIYSDVIRNDADQTYSNGRYHYTATVDMNRVSGGSNNKPYVLAWDYGPQPLQGHHDRDGYRQRRRQHWGPAR